MLRPPPTHLLLVFDKPRTDLLPLKRIPERSVMSAGGSSEWVGDDALNGDGKWEEVEVLSGPSLTPTQFPTPASTQGGGGGGDERKQFV